MKTIICLIFSMLFLAQTSFSIDSLSFRLTVRDGLGAMNNNLIFGVHKDATDTIDYFLGENKLPEFPPPDDIYCIFYITDSTDMSRYQSYNDFRPVGPDSQFYRIYRFKMFNLTTAYSIQWQKLGPYVDSAFIKDIFTGDLVNLDMKKQTSFSNENFAQDQFEIYVYYNQEPVIGVEETPDVKTDLMIYPNPVNNNFSFLNNNKYDNYIIFNQLGQKITEGKINEIEIEFSDKPQGVYYLMVYDLNGNSNRIKFIKY
jgi:hypothetical protein